MKRSKLGAAEHGRRARLQTSTVETIDAADPIAAAAQAKLAREGQYWHQPMFTRIVSLLLLPKLCVCLQRLALKQQQRQQQRLLQAKPKPCFMTTKVLQYHQQALQIVIGPMLAQLPVLNVEAQA